MSVVQELMRAAGYPDLSGSGPLDLLSPATSNGVRAEPAYPRELGITR